MSKSSLARLSLSLVASALTAVAVGCGGANPMAPSASATAASGQAASYGASTRSIAQSASATPIFVDGGGKTNYTCRDLAAMYAPAGTEWFDVKLEGQPLGSPSITDNVITVNFTNGTATGFNFTSSMPVDAVFVKSGQGHNLYMYSGEVTGDSGLTTPFADNKYQDISHVNFCYDVELAVSKSAATTFTRDYDWSIAKSVDAPVVTVPDAGSATVNYSVAVTKDAGTDSDWAVSGSITVTNPHPALAVSGLSVTDSMSDFGAVAVSCPSSTLGPLASMTCSYATAVGSGSARTNTASADSTTYGITQGQGTAPVAFVTPTTVLDNAVTVTDTFAGAGLPAGAISASQAFTYARTLAAANFTSCGVATTFGNTATIGTDDGGSRSASASVSATLTCPPPPPPVSNGSGCTLTQGYWGTHSSKGPAKYDATWALVGENTPFYLSGASYYGVLQLPTKGNAYYQLAHQFIAAKLNILKGAPAPAGFNMAPVEAFFAANTPAQIAALKGNAPLRAQALAWATTLDRYNNGLLNAPHCS